MIISFSCQTNCFHFFMLLVFDRDSEPDSPAPAPGSFDFFFSDFAAFASARASSKGSGREGRVFPKLPQWSGSLVLDFIPDFGTRR